MSKEFNENAVKTLIESFEKVATNKIYQIQRKNFTSPGNKAVKLADSILKSEKTEDFDKLALNLSRICLELIQLRTNQASARESLCTKLHCCCKNAELKDLFLKVVMTHDGADDNTCMFLLNSILKFFFQISLNWRNEKLLSDNTKTIDVKLSIEEQTTLRYVAGFIPFSLGKRFKNKQNSDIGKMVMETILSWQANPAETDKTFLEFSKSWTEKVNRGGLFLVNDDFFIFIRRIENVARSVLNCNLILNYKGEDLRDVLMEKFNKSELIDIGWESLTKNLQSEETKKLLKQIILRKWVGIRAKSFLKCWVRMLKRKKQNVSEKSEPSLRKTLHTKKN